MGLALGCSMFVTAAGFCLRASADEPSDDWAAIQKILSGIEGVATNPIPDVVTVKYTAGMLMGNGDIGAVAGDTATTQKFYFGKGDFLGQTFDQTRQIWGNSIIPIGTLTVSFPGAGDAAAGAYRMEQDILHAEVRTTLAPGGNLVTLQSWISATENAFVTTVSNAAAGPMAVSLCLVENANPEYPSAGGSANGVLWVTRENDNRSDIKARVALALRVIGAPFSVTATGSTNACGKIDLAPGSTVTIVVAIRGDGNLVGKCAAMESLKTDALGRAAAISPEAVEEMASAHRDWWKQYWLRSYVSIHDSALEKYYYGSLYVLGSAARPGRLLPSMWGMWSTTDSPRWGGRHFFNYNAQAPYYGIASANRPELILPYSEFVSAELPVQVNATHAAGYQGCTFRRSMMPLDLYRPKPAEVPVAAAKDYRRLPTDQKSNGSFAAMPMIMYYQYTRDDGYLKRQLYPLLKELDAFWRDYLDRENLTNGGYRYVVNHSGCHEFPNAAAANDVNPDLDIGFIRTTCRMLLDGSRELGVDENMRPVWQDTLDHLSAYPSGVYDGKECFLDAESVRGSTVPTRLLRPGGQPVNMEGAVHPGENVTLGGDPREIQMGLNTLAYMHSWGLSGGSANNGFVKVWPQAVRLGWPAEDFINKFKTAINFLWRESNLTCFQGGGGIETCGSIDAINSMLLQSNFEQLRLFPVWPASRDASFKRLRAKGAFVVSSEFTGGRVAWVDVLSEKGRPLVISNPWGTDTIEAFDVTGGASVPVQPVLKDGKITLSTTAGRTYHFAAPRG
jgi:hypothetical protein